MNLSNINLFNVSKEMIAYNIQENQCLEVGNKFIIDTIPEFQFSILNLMFSFIFKVMIIKYVAWILGDICEYIFKKRIMVPYPTFSKKFIKENIKDITKPNKKFYFEERDLFYKIMEVCNLAIEFRILFGIQYIIF